MKKLDVIMLTLFVGGVALFGGVACFSYLFPEFALDAEEKGIVQKTELGLLGFAALITLVVTPYYSIHREFFVGEEDTAVE